VPASQRAATIQITSAKPNGQAPSVKAIAEAMVRMTDMLEALDRKRGKGPQVVRVERVVVNEGGQAIVGNVQPAVSKVGER
jgi:hypothetical protein